jgi:hypothetical protein
MIRVTFLGDILMDNKSIPQTGTSMHDVQQLVSAAKPSHIKCN